MNENFMKEKPVFPLLVSMALPMVISMLVNALYNIVDSFFVAQISEDAMTALSLVYPVQNFVNAVAIGFGIGINAVISYFLGAGDQRTAGKAASQGLVLTMLHGLILTIGSIFVIRRFLLMFSSSEEVIDLGVRYARIVFAFTLVVMASLYFEKVFQALGKMKLTMFGMMCGCIVNILLDPVLIFGIGFVPKLGIEGAALATGIGQVVSVVVYLVFYRMHPMQIKIKKEYLHLDKKMAGRLYAIGIPAILNLALPSLLISCLNGILAVYSQSYVVILGIYYKLQTFIYLTANGIVQGMRPVIGFNYGAGETKRVHKIYEITLLMCAVIMLAGTVICQIVPQELIALFSSNPETISLGGHALRIISAGFVISAVSTTSSGALEGLGKGTESLIISLCRNVIIILPAAFLFSKIGGGQGVWHAFWVTEVLSAIVSLVVYQRAVRKEQKQEK